jgi:hypothetical protein
VNRIVIALLLSGSGCMRGATEDHTETPPPEPRNEAVFAAQPEARNDAVIAALSDEEAAYFEDCSHRFQVQDEESEAMVDECSYLPFDQNCSSDPSGCWAGGEECATGCAKSCSSCDAKCNNGCEGCKGKCKPGDSECIAGCATERVACRDACMEGKTTCVDKTCPQSTEKCYAEHEKLVAERCPKCQEIEDCIEEVIGGSGERDPMEVCGRKFKREPDQCFEWCAGF